MKGLMTCELQRPDATRKANLLQIASVSGNVDEQSTAQIDEGAEALTCFLTEKKLIEALMGFNTLMNTLTTQRIE